MMIRNLRKYIYTLEYSSSASRLLSLLLLKTYSLPFKFNLFSPKADLKIEHLISHSNKFVYICIPKAGSRSILNSFVGNTNFPSQPKILETRLDLLISQIDFNQYFFFTIVRNPIDRIISCYREKILNPGNIQRARILARYKDLYEKMPFYEFVDWLNTPAGSDTYADRHWISQHQLITDSYGDLVCNFIGRLEHLQNDMHKLCDILDIPYLNVSEKKTNPSFGTVILTEDIKKKIYSRYRKDFELLGYNI